jgi:hypothetical protein
VNVFNVRYIDQLAWWIQEQNFDYVYWNIMHDAWYFSIATLPDAAKTAVTHHLKFNAAPARYQQDINGVVDFMNGGASTDGFVLRSNIADLDRKRNQDFAAICPEMAQLIEYTFNG